MCQTSLEDVYYGVGQNMRNDAFILMSTRRADHGTIFSSYVKNAEHTRMCTYTHVQRS